MFTLATKIPQNLTEINCIILSLLQQMVPHVFSVAAAMYAALRRDVGTTDQSVIISGESGAGKVGEGRKWDIVGKLGEKVECGEERGEKVECGDRRK